jgi:hypothetical protein
MRLLLVPSPFVGAVTWEPVQQVRPDAVVVELGRLDGQDVYGEVTERVADAAGRDECLVVLHSSAGSFAPALVPLVAGLRGLIFVDAVLPHPGRAVMDIAPPEQIDHLRQLATGGRMAPWNAWFPKDPTVRWIPDAGMRARFLAGLPHAPLAFLETRAPASELWADAPCAFVRLSREYEANTLRAEAMGWPVRRAELTHLAMFTHPGEVARLLDGLPFA